MSRTAKCSVAGCPGVMTFDSDGRGSVKGECPCCEKREAWKLANLPDMARRACGICAGQFATPSKGPVLKYCPVCRPLATRKLQRDYKAKTRTPKLTLRVVDAANARRTG